MSIKHLQDLPVRQFLDVIQRFDEFTITEKIDGAALIVGCDNEGRVYTSRANKGDAKRYYHDYSYRETPANAGFINAHRHLTLGVNPALVPKGCAYEVEVLFGRQPNAIIYGRSRVVFLRPLVGDNGEMSAPCDQTEWIKEFKNRWQGAVPSVVIVSRDGKTTERVDRNLSWRSDVVPSVDHTLFGKPPASDVAKLTKWLKCSGWSQYTNEEVLNINLTKLSIDERQSLRTWRDETRATADKMKADIVQQYIDVLRAMKSGLCDVELKDGEDIGIEGVVFLNPETQEQFKIVNKKEFTAINAFNHIVRNSIRKTSHGKLSDDIIKFGGLHQLVNDDSTYDNFLSALADELWHWAKLTTGMGVKRELRKIVGDKQDRAQALTDYLTNDEKHVAVFRSSVVFACNVQLKYLENKRTWYMEKVAEFGIQLDGDRWLGYNKAIHERTMLTFAELDMELVRIRDVAMFARDKKSIIEEIFRKQLAGL